MPRTSKARIFRSTQTAPNASTVRDLTTAFGAAANNATTAAFAIAGGSGFRWNPNTTGTAASPPAVGTAPTANAWRDTVAESATNGVTYAAGTWTVKVRVNKTVMTVNASVTVRVTVIVYRVTSTGGVPVGATNNGEIGRVVLADTALPTVNAAVAISGSFTTPSAIAFDAGDKVQVQCYVQNIVSGSPAAATAGYTVAFVVDEAAANGANFTALPTHALRLTQSAVDSAPASDAAGRNSVLLRGLSDSAAAADALARSAHRRRGLSDSAAAADALARLARAWRATPDSAPASDLATRSLARARAAADTASAADAAARRAVVQRAAPDNAPASDSVVGQTARPRAVTDSAPASDVATRNGIYPRVISDSAPAADSVSRRSGYPRSLVDTAGATDGAARRAAYPRPATDSAPASDAATRSTTVSRFVTDSAPAVDATDRIINYVRVVVDDIGPGEATVITTPPPALIIVDGEVALRIGGRLYQRA